MSGTTLNPEALYRADDPALRVIAKVATMRKWRHEGTGPKYIKMSDGRSGRILYRGRDLLDWLDAHLIERPPETT